LFIKIKEKFLRLYTSTNLVKIKTINYYNFIAFDAKRKLFLDAGRNLGTQFGKKNNYKFYIFITIWLLTQNEKLFLDLGKNDGTQTQNSLNNLYTQK